MFMNLEQLYKVSVSCTAISFAYIFLGGNTGLQILQKGTFFSFFFFFLILNWSKVGYWKLLGNPQD